MPKSNRIQAIELRGNGIFSVISSGEEVKLAEPLKVTAFPWGLHGRDKGQAYTEVKFKDRNGDWKTEIIRPSLLSSKRREFIELLSNRGYNWPANTSAWPQIMEALSRAKPRRRFYVTSVPGWHESVGKAFVLPGGIIAKKRADRKAFRLWSNPTVHLGDFAVQGTLEAWQDGIGKLCRQSTRARLAVAAAFAAPNLRPLKFDSFGFNFSGKSSSGKTLLIRLAASVAGLNGAGGPATWDGSPAGFEQRALGHRDCVMPLDDLSHLEGDTSQATKLAKLVTFRLASNKPKTRAGQYVDAHQLVEVDWRVIPLSTSEYPLWSRRAPGQNAIRGEEIRMINIRACVSEMDDIFDGSQAETIVGTTLDQRLTVVERLEDLSRQLQGTPFRAYLRRRLRDADAEKMLKQYIDAFPKAVPLPDGARALGRIRRYFAVIYASAAQAIDYGILPWKKGATLHDLKRCMDDAMDQLTSPSFSNSMPITPHDEDLISEFQKRLRNTKFIDPTGATTDELNSAAGVKRPGENGKVRYLLFSKTMDLWFPDSISRKRLAAALSSRGLIKASRRADSRTVQTHLAALGKRLPCYHLRRRKVLDYINPAQ
jgi:putative DNA primase/helicase